ncbi:MAG: Na(+)/H(+) antiporter NhaD [Pseudomonadota bacterium]|jgi:Na+/H+ antiporter NhaD/arsenite permease-like protein
MTGLLIALFALAYAAIALEEPLRINKSAAALLAAGSLWTVYALVSGDPGRVQAELGQSVRQSAEIAFFLIGAMTIVAVIDAHDGFALLTRHMAARSLSVLAWMIGGATFFLSAVLDNLTTAIIMVSLLGRLVAEREDRLWLAGLVVICANAGGAWSPIGDVTTTMLWIGGQVTSTAIVTRLFLPSLANGLVAILFVSWKLRGKPVVAPAAVGDGLHGQDAEQRLMFGLGLGVLLAVPLFKAVTHLPPFLAILFGLGIVWAVGDWRNRRKSADNPPRVTIAAALTRIDMSAIVFFIGILLAVATLEHAKVLIALAAWLDAHIGRIDGIVGLIGLISAVIDNVPMVAATIGMYGLDQHPTDSFLWEFLAYCAGTGGSILIIGSAAGVAAMGIERMGFLWYMRRFSLLALVAYGLGAAVYVIQSGVIS